MLELNRITLMQERFNAHWVRKNGYGRLFRNDKDLVTVFADMASQQNWQELHQNITAYQNDAVFCVRDKIIELLGNTVTEQNIPQYKQSHLAVSDI